ncbi:MAG: DNA-3-methyladenine glycosylase [Candidatus Limnocylindrales bacterium]
MARHPPGGRRALLQPGRWPSLPPPLARSFFESRPDRLARSLLGCLLVRQIEGQPPCGGVIVETEAYDGAADLASHARFGRTARTASMFGPGGHAYVFLVYGMHSCLNVVSGPDGGPGAVLVRALAPRFGSELMRQLRGRPHDAAVRLAAGPGRLGQALAIDRTLDGVDLTEPRGPLWLAAPPLEVAASLRHDGVAVGRRVGVAYAGPPWAQMPWRFGWRDHAALSRPFAAAAGRPPRGGDG